MKDLDLRNAFDEKKFEEEYTKWLKAKKLSEKYLYDTEYVIMVIDMLMKKGVLSILGDQKDPTIWNEELECYTPSYAMYIWRECALPALGYSYKEYQSFNDIVKSLEKVGKSI